MAAMSRMRVGSPSTRKVSARAWAVSADSGGATGAGRAAADSGPERLQVAERGAAVAGCRL